MKNLCIETYQTGKAALKAGAVDHIAIDVTDIEEAYQAARELGCPFFEEGISFLPFWERGIRYFILLGPNQEKIEFCQKLSICPVNLQFPRCGFLHRGNLRAGAFCRENGEKIGKTARIFLASIAI